MTVSLRDVMYALDIAYHLFFLQSASSWPLVWGFERDDSSLPEERWNVEVSHLEIGIGMKQFVLPRSMRKLCSLPREVQFLLIGLLT